MVTNGLHSDVDEINIRAKFVSFPKLYRVQQRSAPNKIANAIIGGCPIGGTPN